MLLIKPGARVTGLRPEMLLAVVAAHAALEEFKCDCVITAGVDGKHKPGSLHYAGSAVDLRTRDLSADNLQKFVARLRECLSNDFDVVLETDHVHVEFQPKQPLSNA
jgi:hypothetical protein